MTSLPYKPSAYRPIPKFTCSLETKREFLLARDPFARALALSVEPGSTSSHPECLLGFATVLVLFALFVAYGITR